MESDSRRRTEKGHVRQVTKLTAVVQVITMQQSGGPLQWL